MKHKILGMLAVGLSAGPIAVNAVTLSIAAVIDGTTYSHLDWSSLELQYFSDVFAGFENSLDGIVAPIPFAPGATAIVLQLISTPVDGVATRTWAFTLRSRCSASACSVSA